MNAAVVTLACLILAGVLVWGVVIHRAAFQFLHLLP